MVGTKGIVGNGGNGGKVAFGNAGAEGNGGSVALGTVGIGGSEGKAAFGSGGNVALGRGGRGGIGNGGGAASVSRSRRGLAKLILMLANDKDTNNNFKQLLKAAMVLNQKEASFFQSQLVLILFVAWVGAFSHDGYL